MGFLIEMICEMESQFDSLCDLLINEEIASTEEYEELVAKFKEKAKEAISMAEYLY